MRGMGFCVCPSKVLGTTCHCGSSASGVALFEYDRLKSELQTSNERVQALEQQVAKVKTLEQQMAFLMQNFGVQFLSRINEVNTLVILLSSKHYDHCFLSIF